MLTIEHNPTHIEQAHSEGMGPPGQGNPLLGDTRLDGIAHKKGRKNDGLGGFAKLLAGLISKKTKVQPQGMASQEGSEAGEAVNAKNARKEKSFRLAGLHLADEGKQRKILEGKEENAVPFLKKAKEKDATETQTQTGVEALALIRIQAEDQELLAKEGFSAQKASMKGLDSEQEKNRTERKLPLFDRKLPEDSVLGENAALRFKKGEKSPQMDEKGEPKKADKRRDRVALDVRDLRTQTGSEPGLVAERGLKVVEEIRTGQEKEIVLELRPVGEQPQGSVGTEAKPNVQGGENFSQLLARELNGSLSTDIVRQAAIVLRDGGEGTIRLSLRPESLGKVKIHLEMAENKVSGHIFVETEEALRAFEQEIHTLEQSFRDSGFEASLSAALDYRNDGQRWKEQQPAPFFSDRLAASYEETAAMELAGGYGFELSAVNMLV